MERDSKERIRRFSFYLFMLQYQNVSTKEFTVNEIEDLRHMMSFHYSKKSSSYFSYSFQNQPSVNVVNCKLKQKSFATKTVFNVNSCYLCLDGVSDIIGVHLFQMLISLSPLSRLCLQSMIYSPLMLQMQYQAATQNDKLQR